MSWSASQLNQEQKSVQRNATQPARSTNRQDNDSEHPTATLQRAQIAPHTLSPQNIMQLQRAVGNQAVKQLFRKSVASPVVQRYPKATDNNSEHGFYPLGFGEMGDFQLFTHMIYSNLPTDDAKVVIHGSSVTGVSYKDKGSGSREFDKGRTSDYDVAIVSNKLFTQAAQLGVKIRGDHSEPLTDEQLELLGMKKARDAAQGSTAQMDPRSGNVVEREVNFMLYGRLEDASAHTGPSLLANYDTNDYRESTTSLWGNIDFDQDRGSASSSSSGAGGKKKKK
jgi:hypothetical protein